MNVVLIAPSLIALFTFACSDDADRGAQDSAADTSTPETIADTNAETAAPDTTPETTAPDAPPDSEPADTTEPPDTTPDDTADTTEPGDTTADTASDADTTACEYFEEREILRCGQALTQILHWKDFGPGGCPDYYTRGEDRYDTVAALAQAEGCDASCVYRAATSVDFIRCDGAGRSGFDTYTSDDPSCTDTPYATPDGIFPDLCFWALYACYCEEPE